MKRIFRWALGLFMALVILLVAAILLLDTIAREIVTRQIRNQTGLEAKIGRIHVGLLQPEVTIENLVLYNPAEFGNSPFVDLLELHIEYDRDALFANKLHCKLVRFNLAQVNIVEDKNGRRNFDVLQSRSRPPGATPRQSQTDSPPKQNSRSLEFTGIDSLNLTLGKATYRRLDRPGQTDELSVNMDHQIFPSIRSEQDVYGLLLIIYLKSNASTIGGGSGMDWLQLFSPKKQSASVSDPPVDGGPAIEHQPHPPQ